jgi:hypothetical protein
MLPKLRAASTAPAPVAPSRELVKEAHGFKLMREQYVKEYDSLVGLYKHVKTGTESVCAGRCALM